MTIQNNFKWLALVLLMLITSIVHAAALLPESLTMIVGKTATVTVSEIKGTAKLFIYNNTNTNNLKIISAAFKTSTSITVTALNPGTAKLTVTDSSGSKFIYVTVKLPMTVSSTEISLAVPQTALISVNNATGEVRLTNSNSEVVSASVSGSSIQLEAKSAGTAMLTVKDNLTTLFMPITITGTASTAPYVSGNVQGRLLASNCFQCHGTYGSGGFDPLIGSTDLYGELLQYKNGAEDPDGIMAAHVKGYTDKQLQDIADYFANP